PDEVGRARDSCALWGRGGLLALLGRGGWLAWQPAPLARPDAVVRVPGHKRDRRGLDHAVVLAHDAPLAAFVMFDHDSLLEYRPNPNRLAIDHRVEATADFVVGGWEVGRAHV